MFRQRDISDAAPAPWYFSPAAVILALMAFHVALWALFYGLAHTSFMAGYHNGHGLWWYAGDAARYHKQAAEGARFLSQGSIIQWLNHGDAWFIRVVGLIYLLFGAHPFVVAPLLAVLWTATVLACRQICLLLAPDRPRVAWVVALVVGWWPSFLMHSIHLLKDPFYTLGVVLFIWAWLRLIMGRGRWRDVLLILLSVGLTVQTRLYTGPIWLALTCLGLGLFLVFSRRHWALCLVAAVLSAGVCLGTMTYLTSSAATQYTRLAAVTRPGTSHLGANHLGANHTGAKPPGATRPRVAPAPHRPANTPPVTSPAGLVGRVWRSWAQNLVLARQRFVTQAGQSRSNLYAEVSFDEPRDVLRFIPQALLVGFASPFPVQWFRPGQYVGLAGRLVTGLEMVGFYLVYLGFFLFLFRIKVPLPAKILFVCLALGPVTLLGLAIPNAGAIARMRFPYMVPVIIGGLMGLDLAVRTRLKRRPQPEDVEQR